MKAFLLLILALHSITVGQTQNSATDTTRYSPLRADINDRNWSVAINTGFQKRFFAGAGIAHNHFLGSRHGVYGYDIYAGINFFPAVGKAQQVATGLRLGANFFGNGFFMGAETQYLQAGSTTDFLFTPKAGIGFSMLYLAYGYSISANKFPVAGISQNALSLQINTPFYTKNLITKKAEWWPALFGSKKR